MRIFSLIICMVISSSLFAQSKSGENRYDHLYDLEGTEYIVAAVSKQIKSSSSTQHEHYLLFINADSGEELQVNFPGGQRIGQVKQVKVDAHKINLLLVEAKTIDNDGKKGIGYTDPTQLFVVSTDGKKKTQITPDNYFVRSWEVNKETGKAVITGFLDKNKNNTYDKEDENKLILVDLRKIRF